MMKKIDMKENFKPVEGDVTKVYFEDDTIQRTVVCAACRDGNECYPIKRVDEG